ncbi:MAG TPA: SDR family NAD(P)-dependent oxidoreductase, partial [Candidatus Saccharimonadales bacterium]|nr:SDR family NAD(P)-dependent oxidoreductase [Candidatus Saccharimonadales bacterium]
MDRLKGKNVLITGSATGIGEAAAIRFAREGANVAINHYSDAAEADQTKQSVERVCQAAAATGCQSLVVQADVSNQAEVAAMFEQVLGAWKRLDILINNAGIQKQAPSHQMTLADFDKVVNTNLRGAYVCARAAIEHFLNRPGGGVILNNSSVHELIPKPDYIGYSVSKGGLQNLT